MAQNAHAIAVYSRARVNSFYRAALESSPQYVEASALRAKLLKAQHSLPAAPAVSAPQTADDHIAAWLVAVAEADAAERARQVKTNALAERIIWCDKVVEDTAVAETDRILTALHDALVEVMDQVSAVVDRLDGARTPEQVIDRGVGDVWKGLRPLRDDYDAIRQAQEWQMAGEDQLTWSRSTYLLDDALATDTAIRNLDEIFVAWREPDTTHTTLSDAPQADPRPWPQDPITQLVWLAASPAKPWVPTSTDLQRLHAERRKRADTEPAVVHGRPGELPSRVVTTAAGGA
jgi:hypothetical protein